MRVQTVFEVGVVAAATMIFTLSVIGPWNIGVSDESKNIVPRILRPTFPSQGCTFSLKTEKTQYQAGEPLTMELKAVNPTEKAVTATVWIVVSSAKVPSPMSRVMTFPRPTWSKSWSVALTPGETKTAKFVADVKLTADQNISIAMSDKEQTVMVKELPVLRDRAATKDAAR